MNLFIFVAVSLIYCHHRIGSIISDCPSVSVEFSQQSSFRVFHAPSIMYCISFVVFCNTLQYALCQMIFDRCRELQNGTHFKLRNYTVPTSKLRNYTPKSKILELSKILGVWIHRSGFRSLINEWISPKLERINLHWR